MTAPTPTEFHHTSFLVRDLEGTAQRLSDSLGIGPWNIWTIEPAHCLVHEEESPFSFRVALAEVGSATFELITPKSGRSVYETHLATHGDGFHHACFVYSSLEAVREAKAALRRQGRVAIQEGGTGDVFDFAYFQFEELNAAVEVLFLDASKLPPPEKVVRPASSVHATAASSRPSR